MSQLSIRNTLLQEVINTSTVPVAFENQDFDPSDLDAWVAFFFIPASSESGGKTSASSDEERGFIQLSIYIKLNAETYDNKQFELIDLFKTNFYNGNKFGNVWITDVEINGNQTSGAWVKRDLTINYLTYEQRV